MHAGLFTLLCHFVMILKLLFKQRAFLTQGRLSIAICEIELTSLVSVLFLLIEQKFLEKLELTFLFVKPPSVHGLCTHRLHEDRFVHTRYNLSSAHFDPPEQPLYWPLLIFTFQGLRPGLIPKALQQKYSNIFNKDLIYQPEKDEILLHDIPTATPNQCLFLPFMPLQ